MTTRTGWWAAALAVTLVAVLAVSGSAQDKKSDKLLWTAFMVNMNAGPNTGTVNIALERLSTPEERESLVSAFVEKKQDGLLKALQKVKPRVGYVQVPRKTGWDIKFARRIMKEDGTSRVIILTDRRIEYWEARNNPRTMDYPFSLIELQLDKDGNGKGVLAYAVKIEKDKDGNQLELEHFGISPVALNEVKLQK